MIYVDVIDQGCALRRRAIAVRAHREMLYHRSHDSFAVRVHETVANWKELKNKPDDCHIIFLHAPNQIDWEEAIKHFFKHSARLRLPGLVVTYTGGTETPLPVGQLSVEGQNSRWWRHFTEVKGVNDYPQHEEAAKKVGNTLPPVEKLIREVLRDNSDEPSMGVEATAIFPIKQGGPDLRHLLVNAVSPLRIAALQVLANQKDVEELPPLWERLKARLVPRADILPVWVTTNIDTLETGAVPELSSPARREPALKTITYELGRIERYASAINSMETNWDEVRNILPLDDIKSNKKLLWIDDEDSWFLLLKDTFKACGFEVEFSSDIQKWTKEPDQLRQYDAVLLDIGLEGCGPLIAEHLLAHRIQPAEAAKDENAGVGLLQLFQQALVFPPPIYMLSAHESAALIQACTHSGASGYFVKDKTDYLAFLTGLAREIYNHRALRASAVQPRNSKLIVGDESDPLADVLLKIAKITEKGTPGPVILVGEPGVGKEELAREIYLRSGRPGKLHTTDFSTIVPDLIESELFGHRKGAFSGATENRPGAFEVANNQSLFIDEIDKLGPPLQNKLLSALERKIIKRVGEPDKERPVDVTVILGSNDDPELSAAEGRFSEQLISRITFKIIVPPLRERASAIGKLAQGLCDDLCEKNDWPRTVLSTKAISWLHDRAKAGHFDGSAGNVRGLRKLLVQVLTHHSEGQVIDVHHLQKTSDEQKPQVQNIETNGAFIKVGELLAGYLGGVDEAKLDQIEDRVRAALFKALRARMDRKEIAALFGYTADNLRQKFKELRAKGLLSEDI